MTTPATDKTPKHQQVFETLRREILSGKYRPGQKLPSEADLVKRFGASRITVGRAVQELRQRDLVERRAGSGTYLRATKAEGFTFGLLIPDLGQTDIFEPMRHGMADHPQASEHALLWGNATWDAAQRDQQAWQLCQQYIARRVSGVFFAPLERIPAADETNRKIVAALEKARIPIVLLDRPYVPYPQSSPYDLVGIDNRQAGYLGTEHLLKLGARRIAFLTWPNPPSTIEARIAGYREALFMHEVPYSADFVHHLDLDDREGIRRAMERTQADAFLCANDRIAGNLMHTLAALGHRVPQDVRVVGIDDAPYASLLPVPLTTIRQPCREIGIAAMAVMLERIARPEMPPRDVLLRCDLVVRASCGAEA